MFLEKLNTAFPAAISDGKHRHNVSLTADGVLDVTVWNIDGDGHLRAYFCRLQDDDDFFQSFDDIVEDLRKYISSENA